MNEIEAHELNLELWTWLADNPNKSRSDWPDYEKQGLEYIEMECFLCEIYLKPHYENPNDYGKCKGCCLDCLQPDSIYDDYCSTNKKLSQKAAEQIRDKIKAKLDELRKLS